MASLSAKLHLPATILALLAISISVYGTSITIHNQCSYNVTTYCQPQVPISELPGWKELLPGGAWQISMSNSSWNLTIWGFGNTDASQVLVLKPQANLAKFFKGINGAVYYGVSNVNAYNIGVKINVTNIPSGRMQGGLQCGSPTCTIRDLATICKAPNVFTTYNSISQSCKNTDGLGNVATDGTKVFKVACSSFKSYSQDNDTAVYNCDVGSNYEVVFCPDYF